MERFDYVRTKQARGAIRELLKNPKAAYLAGGTTLVDLIKLGVESPGMLVDIGSTGLTEISVSPTGTRLGALARNSDLAHHSGIVEQYPAISQAILSGATPQIRNMATLGGNLLQRTRCSYFRDNVSACNKRRPGSGCAAREGFNRSHAILGGGEQCIATHPSDLCLALAIFEAVVHVDGKSGQRTIPFESLYTDVAADPSRETVLEHGDMITAVDLPSAPYTRMSVYEKVRDRESYEFALASAAVMLEVTKDRITTVRIALGGVATRPMRSREAEQALLGRKPDAKAFAAAAEAALRGAKPLKHNAFKVELAKRTLVRALERVLSVSK